MEVLQIVPRLPPSVCGVGDYAWLLARAMRSAGAPSRFVVADRQWRGQTWIDGFGIEQLPESSSSTLLQTLERSEARSVLLHFVGYGYDDRGCPWWLVEALREWKSAGRGRRLVTMFHEIYAAGPPWRRVFWDSRAQRTIAAQVADLSDECRTSLALIAERLGRLSPRHAGRVEVMPVFSTIGEPEDVVPLQFRQRHLVVFGSAGLRRQAYTRYRAALLQVCRALEVEKVVDIGKPLCEEVRLPLPIEWAGMLPAPQVSTRMNESLAGFLCYPERILAKSTIFAAYCAHGLLPICCGRGGPGRGDVVPGLHFWRARRRGHVPTAPEAQSMAEAARFWYRGHSLQSQASAVADLAGAYAPERVLAGR